MATPVGMGKVNQVVAELKNVISQTYEAALKTIPAKGAQSIAQSMPKQ